MSDKDRLDRLEASHVRLMTEHEMEVRRNDKAWKRHRRFVRELDTRLEARWAADDARWAAQREEQRKRGEELDSRIEKLVSAIGAFIAAKK